MYGAADLTIMRHIQKVVNSRCFVHSVQLLQSLENFSVKLAAQCKHVVTRRVERIEKTGAAVT